MKWGGHLSFRYIYKVSHFKKIYKKDYHYVEFNFVDFFVPIACLASVGKGRIGEFGPKTAASEEERIPSRLSRARKRLSPCTLLDEGGNGAGIGERRHLFFAYIADNREIKHSVYSKRQK